MLFNKSKPSEKITPVEGDKIFKQGARNAEILNTFFTNPVKNLNIPEFEEVDPFAEKNINSDIESNFKMP